MAVRVERFYALFDSPIEVRQALARLAEDGVTADRIEVRSSIPLAEDIHPVGQRIRSWVSLMAVLGGLLGGTAAFLGVRFTAFAYPLPTGGMPIFPLMPTGIITFEGIAIGAILFTVATVFLECGMPNLRWRVEPFDRQLAEGKIVVAVQQVSETSTEWARTAAATETQ